MNVTTKLIGTAQLLISVTFLTGYFTVLALFILGYVRTPPEWKDALQVLLGALTAGVGMILAYWFSRSRTAEPQ